MTNLTYMHIDYWKRDSLPEPHSILLEQADLALKKTEFENDKEFREVVIINLVWLLGLEGMQSHIQRSWGGFSWAGIFGTHNEDIQSLWIDLYDNRPFLGQFFWSIRPLLLLGSSNLGNVLDHVVLKRQEGAQRPYLIEYANIHLMDDFVEADLGLPSDKFISLNLI